MLNMIFVVVVVVDLFVQLFFYLEDPVAEAREERAEAGLWCWLATYSSLASAVSSKRKRLNWFISRVI